MKIERNDNLFIKIHSDKGGHIKSQSVESNLLFAILEKLEEIRIGVIDVEIAVEKEKL